MNKFLITTIILIFFNSTIVKALQIECRTYGNSEYQLIKDSKGITLDHNNRYNSLIQESYINFIFYKKYAVINLTIKYYYLSDSKKK